MNNILNIDLVNGLKSVTISHNDSNSISLNIMVSNSLTNIYLELKNQNGSAETITNLSIDNDVIVYELPFDKYSGIGNVEIKVKANGYTSETIIISSSEVNTSTDKLEVKYNETTNIFNIRRLNLNKYKDVPIATTQTVGVVIVGENLEIESDGTLNSLGAVVNIIRY